MDGAKERIDFIIEYISAYEAKIKLANKSSLFDEAKLFELFAQEICNLWYGQKFNNLNNINKNYPCVDLLSDDGSIYVQVSTEANIMSKVKKTLNALKDSTVPELEKITAPVFFVLSNVTESSVHDLVGDQQIGKCAFTVKDNLISTARIIQRASADLDFQIKLYELLKSDVEGLSNIADKLIFHFDDSKRVGLFNIDTTIDGKYEIDRTDLISKIKGDNNQFIIISGEAGSGKSVICKKMVQDEENLLFVRADKIASCCSLDDIWGLDIIKAFKVLKGKRLVIYVDALEYLASARESIKDILQSLLCEIKKYNNIIFVSSCRSCDMGAFVKFFGLFNISKYTVDAISDKELLDLCVSFPVIKELVNTDKYAELVRIPFYINVIVSKKIDLNVASDVNAFRDFIWKECICVRKQAAQKGIATNEVYNTINLLAIERSRRFVEGIPEEEIDLRILELLRSNNVVTGKDTLVRLKYDIYEDICFEKYFDREFDACKSVYPVFFDNIEKVGIGVYRRYQIWISNKLLARENRDRFLHTLVFDSNVSSEWHRNTLIGLLKSSFCKSFFDEQKTNLIENNLVEEFVDIANCFAFEMDGVVFNELKSICSLKLKASGYGRLALILLIFNNDLYKTLLKRTKVVKLCNDYALKSRHDAEIDKYACIIMEYFIDEFLSDSNPVYMRNIMDYFGPMLEVIYSFPKESSNWIDDFWERMKALYLCEDDYKSRIGEDILCWTLDYTNKELVNHKIEGLLDIASTIWTEENAQKKEEHLLYSYAGLKDDYLWGICGPGVDYNYSHRRIDDDYFMMTVFNRKMKPALEWAISLVNRLVAKYSSSTPNDLVEIILFNSTQKEERKYIGSGRMWLAGREDCGFPTLIGDLTYWIKEEAIKILHLCENDKECFDYVAQYIKNQIYTKSTSIIFFAVIEDIGFEFFKELPGYAIDLVSNLTLISWDNQWVASNIDSPAKALLKEQIKLSIGVPDLSGRYPHRRFEIRGLQEYMKYCQLFGNTEIKEQCINVLEYLQRKIKPNDAYTLLQVQSMDLRNANLKKIDDSAIIVEPQFSDETRKIVEENELKNQQEEQIINWLRDSLDSDVDNGLDVVLAAIDRIKAFMSGPEGRIKYENYYIMFLALALKNSNLSKSLRTELVCDWVERIEHVFHHDGECYVADLKLSVVLFEQYYKDIEIDVKNKLKRLILRCLIDYSLDGQISLLRKYIKNVIMRDKDVAIVFFNTIICLAKDEWKHEKYNQRMRQRHRSRGYCISGGHIPSSDEIIKGMGLKTYKSNSETIINKYLYEEKNMKLDDLDVNEVDQGYLFMAMGAGLHFDYEEFYSLAKKMMPILIKSVNEKETGSIMKTYNQRLFVKELFEEELANENCKKAIDLMFDYVDFELFCANTIKMYVSFFEKNEAQYFDAYNNLTMRKHCQTCIEYVEQKVKAINNSYVKHGLERILIFATDRWGTDWNKFESHYSHSDKMFLCGQWEKYYVNDCEKEILDAIYQMKISELLPEVLPVVAKIVVSLNNKKELANQDIKSILTTIILKSLIDFSDRIKMNSETHSSYVRILNDLINIGDERAAVILDEYSLH